MYKCIVLIWIQLKLPNRYKPRAKFVLTVYKLLRHTVTIQHAVSSRYPEDIATLPVSSFVGRTVIMVDVSESERSPHHSVEPHFEIMTGTLGPKTSSESLDKAAVYLRSHAQSFAERSVNSRGLLGKIDWKIIPIAFVCYTMQFMDKININVGSTLYLKHINFPYYNSMQL